MIYEGMFTGYPCHISGPGKRGNTYKSARKAVLNFYLTILLNNINGVTLTL